MGTILVITRKLTCKFMSYLASDLLPAGVIDDKMPFAPGILLQLLIFFFQLMFILFPQIDYSLMISLR